MPKLKNVTAEELDGALSASEDLMATLHNISDRIEKSYCDDIANPIEIARTLNALTRASASLVTNVLFKSSLQEQRQELERLHKARDTAST